MKQRNTIFYHICALATVAAWGVSFICTRVLLDHGLTPIVIYIYRFSLAYIAMLMLSKFKIHFLRAADELKWRHAVSPAAHCISGPRTQPYR